MRWWDGAAWTDQTSPTRAPKVDAAPRTLIPPMPVSPSQRKRQNNIWGLLGFLVLVAIVLSVLTNENSSDDSPSVVADVTDCGELEARRVELDQLARSYVDATRDDGLSLQQAEALSDEAAEARQQRNATVDRMHDVGC